MSEKKSKFASDLSNAQSIAENYEKKAKEALERMEAAEESQRSMMVPLLSFVFSLQNIP
jgi:hypothetical protein